MERATAEAVDVPLAVAVASLKYIPPRQKTPTETPKKTMARATLVFNEMRKMI